MPRRVLAILATSLAIAAGCGDRPESDPPDAGVPADAATEVSDAGLHDAGATVTGFDAGHDAGSLDANWHVGGPCARQSDCGNPLTQEIVDVCTDGHCRTPGAAKADGTAERVQVSFESIYDQVLTQPGSRPQVQLTRLVFATRVDGVKLTCAELLSRSGSTQATRAKLEDDPLLSQAFRSLFVLQFSGSTQGQTLFHVIEDVPRGDDYLLLGEAWYGPREGNLPTGNRASVACTENVDLSAVPAGQKIPIFFKP